MNSQQTIATTCPQCGMQHTAPATPIIDVSQNPALKQTFLQGQLNVGQCPQCGAVYPLNTTMLYHDAEKELALVFSPPSMGVSHDDEQRKIGRLTTQLMNDLPPEQRKGYLFNPQMFIKIDTMIKTILAADGITEEVIEAQNQRFSLLEKLMKVQSEAEINQLVVENKAMLDFQFFEILTSLALQALQSGDEASGQNLLGFRQMLSQQVENGETFVTEIDEKIGLRTLNPENLFENLRATEDDDEFAALVSSGKGLLNYEFFQNLTEKIEAAVKENDTVEAETLKTLRTRIMETASKLEANAKAMMDGANSLLETLLKSSDPQAYIKENLDKFDEAFLSVLVANIQHAEASKQSNAVQALSTLYQMVMNELQSNLPPEMQLLNQLVMAQTPANIKSTLEENKTLITPKFSEMIDALEVDVQTRGELEVLPVLQEIKKQVTSLLDGGSSKGHILIA